MRAFTYILTIILWAMFIMMMFISFIIVLPLFVAGYVMYKIPLVVREQLRSRRALREIIDGD
jgi:hypothetical protein